MQTRRPPAPRLAHRPAAALIGALPLLLGGCVAEQAIGPGLVVGGASIVLTGRTPVDHVASLISGQDCSIVRLERRESWCAPPPGPPPPQAYCTPSLGRVDCWTTPPFGGNRQVADPPGPVPVAPVAQPAAVIEVAPVIVPPPATPAVPPAVPPAAAPPAVAPPAAAPATPVTRPAAPAPRRPEIRT
ncbi:hypothetical protein G3576_11610 [Roseomonas stagni]|uniref:Uncharacterized protein n=1 Tax=Falsiroseomonas algicola TaxID=2716930 RepID=A0A6M1LKJ7_9PROT|nr:hypothetical protein [Falsiroseomonas algicola]NGM20662.1 hypothetical protein [Falsiroseomonas algicola]